MQIPIAAVVVSVASGFQQEATPGRAIVEQMRREAEALGGLVESGVGREFLAATADLPDGEARTIYKLAPDRYCTESQLDQLEEQERAGAERLDLAADRFYTTRYGTPVAYARALDLVGRAGLDTLRGRKVLDYGYGGIGHLRLMAISGADAVGVDVDTFLASLYCKGDQGAIGAKTGAKGTDGGRVRLVHGQWPGTPRVHGEVGGDYDLIISKNTLKRGYVHPAREVDPRRMVHLGVSDEEFVAALYRSLRPGGFAIIYNLSPAQNPPDQPYLPWADGQCPFPRARLEAAGFEVIAYDADDGTAAREMGRALEWDKGEGAMNLTSGLFAHYTLLRRPPAGSAPATP